MHSSWLEGLGAPGQEHGSNGLAEVLPAIRGPGPQEKALAGSAFKPNLPCTPHLHPSLPASQEGMTILKDCKVSVVKRQEIHRDRVTGVWLNGNGLGGQPGMRLFTACGTWCGRSSWLWVP